MFWYCELAHILSTCSAWNNKYLAEYESPELEEIIPWWFIQALRWSDESHNTIGSIKYVTIRQGFCWYNVWITYWGTHSKWCLFWLSIYLFMVRSNEDHVKQIAEWHWGNKKTASVCHCLLKQFSLERFCYPSVSIWIINCDMPKAHSAWLGSNIINLCIFKNTFGIIWNHRYFPDHALSKWDKNN